MRKRQKSTNDYLLASREVNPFFVGLSGAASTASGFGFTGIIGFGYAMGLAGAWWVFGAVCGSLLAFTITSRRFRTYSQRHKSASYTEFLAAGIKPNTRRLQLILGLLGVVCVVLYATAQLTAGSKALYVLFGWPYSTGAILGAVIVLMYCWAGGIRASIWTDVVQIIVMYGSMTILMVVALMQMGGFSGLYEGLKNIDPDLVRIISHGNPFGPLLFIGGCLSVGLSLVGFPHVMVRFMTLKNPKDTMKAIGWYELSYGGFYITAYIVALCTRVLLQDSGSFDKELALAELAQQLLPEILVGVILAGIFAGTISTADSLILSCSANLSRDIFTKYKNSYGFLKFSTLTVTLVALLIALSGSKNVFDLVMFVIALMASGFAPLLYIRALQWPINETLALFMLSGGLIGAMAWRAMGYHEYVFDSFIGMLAAFAIYGVGVLWLYVKPLPKKSQRVEI